MEVSILCGSTKLMQPQPIGNLFAAVSDDEVEIFTAVEYLRTEGINAHILQELLFDDQEETVI